MTIKLTEWIGCTPTSCPTNFGERHAESLEGEAANAPELSISFDTGGGEGMPVCFEFSLTALQDTQLLDDSFIARQTVCENRSGSDRLSINEFNVNVTSHQFAPEDLVFFRIVRPDNFVPNDFEGNVFVLGGELQWSPPT